jgi:SAM-dependent methyltransferase
MGYLTWHEKPGYWGDVVRHFPSETRLLDVGCGGAWLGEHFERYTGVDVSTEAVAAARGRGLEALLIEPGQPLPFVDESFDGVVLKDVLEHVADPVALVSEVRRVLHPGGRVFASSPDAQRWVWDDYTHRRPFTRKSFRLLFADQGFEVERVGYESVMPGTSVVSRRTRRKRRPRLLAAAAWLPLVRRNVWLVARRGPLSERAAGAEPPPGS